MRAQGCTPLHNYIGEQLPSGGKFKYKDHLQHL